MTRSKQIMVSLMLAVGMGIVMPISQFLQPAVTVQAATAESYQLIKSVKIYNTADDAKTGINSAGVYAAGNYYIYRTYNGILNISKQATVPGGWINPLDNQAIKGNPYTASATLGSRLNVDYIYNTIRVLSTQYPNRVFGTKIAADTASYIVKRINNYSYYNIEKQYSKAVNPLLGTSPVNVINVVARPQNYDSKKRDVVFVAHYDTVKNTPGANDNASGVAMLIELSQYFSKNRADFNPVFLVCGGEEKGKPGTEDFIARYKDRLLKGTEVVINLDMVGMSSNYQIWNLNQTMQATAYPQLAYNIGKQLGLRIELKRNSTGIADYKMFELNSIPTVTFMNVTDRYGKNVPYYHTAQDTIDKISKTSLRNVSKLVMNVVEYINRKY